MSGIRLSDTQREKIFINLYSVYNPRTRKEYLKYDHSSAGAENQVRNRCKTVLSTDELKVRFIDVCTR